MSFLYSPLQALDEKVRIETPNLRPDLIIATASYFHGGGTLLHDS